MTNASIQRIAANYVQRFLHVVEIGPILRRRHRGVYRQTPARAHRDHRAAEPENGVDLVQRHRGTLACLLFPVETHRRDLTRIHRTAALTGSANGYFARICRRGALGHRDSVFNQECHAGQTECERLSHEDSYGRGLLSDSCKDRHTERHPAHERCPDLDACETDGAKSKKPTTTAAGRAQGCRSKIAAAAGSRKQGTTLHQGMVRNG